MVEAVLAPGARAGVSLDGTSGWTLGRVGARALAVIVAAFALGWVAMVNGQPFFHPDTFAYVRGPDVAIMKLSHGRFVTEWAGQDPGAVNQRANIQASKAQVASAKADDHSYDDDEVLAGRSIYYGFLTYLGQLAGGFWLTVFVQGLAVALVVEIALRALRITSLGSYAAVMALIATVTPAPYFVGFLMPDIWAGVAIASVAALFAFPGRLTRVDIAALTLMTLFAPLAHNSVSPVLLALIVAGGGLKLLRWRRTPDARLGLAVAAGAIAIAAVGTLAFNLMVAHTVGKPPVMPPFLSARVIADGPGTRYVREHCAQHQFDVCNYADRFPLPVDDFLWGVTAKDGVFETVSSAHRRALGDEQTRFALTVARTYPLQQAWASLKNAGAQLVATDLSDFTYKPSLRATFAGDLPADHLARMRNTVAYRQGWPLKAAWLLQWAATLVSLAAVGGFALRPKATFSPQADADQAAAWVFLLLALAGVLANGTVCGVLSTLYGRYQARVIWCLPLAALLLAYVRTRGREAMRVLRA